MAKNNLVKWIVGASSVLAFTGFVGMAKEFDTTQQNKASATDGLVQSETKESSKDPVKDEFLGLDSSQTYKDYESNEYKGKHHDDDDDDDDDEDSDDDDKYGETSQYNGYSGYQPESGNTTPTKKYRSQAS